MLSAEELRRYARQLVLTELGVAGQETLRRSRAVIVGAGGLGSPAALYLAAAGVGTLGIIDSDRVELSNLHRQILHRTADIGREKTTSAAEAIADHNPNVRVLTYHERLDYGRAAALIPDFDVVVDGSDNYATRYVVNDVSATLGKPWVYGSVERFVGQVSVFGMPDGPCYRCIYPDAPTPGTSPSCEEIGVLGAVPGVVGSLQAMEALKLLLGVGEPLSGRLLQIDLARADFRSVRIERRPDCAACGSAARPTRPAALEDSGTNADIEPRELSALLAEGAGPELIDVRESWEWNIGRIKGARHVAMSTLERQVQALDRGRDLVIYCHHGTRSEVAADWLRSLGFRARNLVGGIDRWSREIDTSVPRY